MWLYSPIRQLDLRLIRIMIFNPLSTYSSPFSILFPQKKYPTARCPRCPLAVLPGDFGMARVLEEGITELLTSQLGTVSHMPPELLHLEDRRLSVLADGKGGGDLEDPASDDGKMENPMGKSGTTWENLGQNDGNNCGKKEKDQGKVMGNSGISRDWVKSSLFLKGLGHVSPR